MGEKSLKSTKENANFNETSILYSLNQTIDVANLSKRMREIPLKSSSLNGIINNNFLGRSIQFESSLERDFVYIMEFDTNVNVFLEQPIEIPYLDEENKLRKYTPDFLVNYFDNKTEIIEIKYESVLDTKYDQLKYKFNGALEFCKKNCFEFRVLTDKNIRVERKVELENFKFLFRYKNFFERIIKTETYYNDLKVDIELLYETIYKLKSLTIKELVSICSKDLEKQSQLIFLTWCLLANNFIKTDYLVKLNLDSIVWYN